jgi:hypothetical protein
MDGCSRREPARHRYRVHVDRCVSSLRPPRLMSHGLKESRRGKTIYGQDEFGESSDHLKAVLADYEAGKAPPEDLLDAVSELRKAIQYASKAFEERHKISLAIRAACIFRRPRHVRGRSGYFRNPVESTCQAALRLRYRLYFSSVLVRPVSGKHCMPPASPNLNTTQR